MNQVAEGQYYNPYYPGGKIQMPQVPPHLGPPYGPRHMLLQVPRGGLFLMSEAPLCQVPTVLLNPHSWTLNLGPSTFDPQPSTLNPQPSTLDPRPSTLNLQPLNSQPPTLNLQPSACSYLLLVLLFFIISSLTRPDTLTCPTTLHLSQPLYDGSVEYEDGTLTPDAPSQPQIPASDGVPPYTCHEALHLATSGPLCLTLVTWHGTAAARRVGGVRGRDARHGLAESNHWL